MRRTYLKPQTIAVRMTECKTLLAAISGGIPNSGQDDDGGGAKEGFVFDESEIGPEDYDLWSD